MAVPILPIPDASADPISGVIPPLGCTPGSFKDLDLDRGQQRYLERLYFHGSHG